MKSPEYPAILLRTSSLVKSWVRLWLKLLTSNMSEAMNRKNLRERSSLRV